MTDTKPNEFKKEIYGLWKEPKDPSIWCRFCLLFVKKYCIYDMGTKFFFKKFKGNIYYIRCEDQYD